MRKLKTLWQLSCKYSVRKFNVATSISSKTICTASEWRQLEKVQNKYLKLDSRNTLFTGFQKFYHCFLCCHLFQDTALEISWNRTKNFKPQSTLSAMKALGWWRPEMPTHSLETPTHSSQHVSIRTNKEEIKLRLICKLANFEAGNQINLDHNTELTLRKFVNTTWYYSFGEK